MSTVIDEPKEIERPFNEEEERTKPMPGSNHAAIQMNLGIEFAKRREFRVFSELDIEINGQKFIPDLALYRREPLDLMRDTGPRQDPPLLTVEILSFGQGYKDLVLKVPIYLAAGVKSCWIVSPPIRAVTIWTPDGCQQSFHTSGIVTDPALGVAVDLAAVFS